MMSAFDLNEETISSKKKDVTLSEEQQSFIHLVETGKNVLVDACIGSGKTTSIQQLCTVLPSSLNILYLTYNTLLKLDAKSKLKMRNVKVHNYHSFAYWRLMQTGCRNLGISDILQTFLKVKPTVPHFDLLIIDEYQDIDLEIAEMLNYIKQHNPKIQIVAVGDMQQKIYDKTSLKVQSFISEFLGSYEQIEFTKCFRINKELADKLGYIWGKQIEGVNADCHVRYMGLAEASKYLSKQAPSDVLCLGPRYGEMTQVLNTLELKCPEKYNKKTVYASIIDTDNRMIPQGNDIAIFTTFDSSKGLERKICVVFDWTEDYYIARSRKPQQNKDILNNIFCVAASRGKNEIIFVSSDFYDDILPKEAESKLLSPTTMMKNTAANANFGCIDISSMFDFKFKEQVEDCYTQLEIEEIPQTDTSELKVQLNDYLIDLSPCLGKYLEYSFFTNTTIEKDIKRLKLTRPDANIYINEKAPLQKQLLQLTAIDTQQYRYVRQVNSPYVSAEATEKIHDRLRTEFTGAEKTQGVCYLEIETPQCQNFSLYGLYDVCKDNRIYELKFVSELQHEHYLQCAMYMLLQDKEEGIIWNVRKNKKYQIRIKDREEFLRRVILATTKGLVTEYRIKCLAGK